jgi:anti-sigma-K factor RskA
MATNHEPHDLAPGYALGVLDEREREAFEEHLEHCESCRGELASLGDAATALAFAAEGPAPPAELRERVVAAARDEGRKVVPLRRRWTPLSVAAIAGAAALALGLGLWATLGTDSPTNRAQRVALQGKVGTLEVDEHGEALLTVRDLDPAPAGKTYEIWVIDESVPTPAGTFTFGGAQVSVKVDGKVKAGSTVGVTLEKLPGARSPTPPILFQASIPA